MLIAVVAWLGLAEAALAQQEDEEKAIKAEVFIKERPAAPKRSRSAGKYKTGSKSTNDINSTPPAGTSFAEVGVTFWRFRPATTADKTKELVEEEGSAPTEWTLEQLKRERPWRRASGCVSVSSH
jgi:hypothetical protein